MEGWPVPTLMIAGGVCLGIFLALAGKFIGAAAVAQALVAEPVELEVGRLRSSNAALDKAAR